jgi:alpha-glucosidase (family GH31 glycosyl hydrolase)
MRPYITLSFLLVVGCSDDGGVSEDSRPPLADQGISDTSTSFDRGPDAPSPDATTADAVDASVADADAATTDILAPDAAPQNKPPWPEWAFHHWVWEDESTQKSATDLVNDYLSHNIPVGAIIIDSPWETGYNTFEWDKTLFPDPKQMITDLHKKNVKVMLWIVSGINTDVQPLYNDAKSKNYFMKLNPFGGPAEIDWWKGTGSLLDYFNPKAVAWWHALVDLALAYDIDGWKCDGLDFSAWLAPFSPGKGFVVSRLEYSDAYYRDFFDYTRKKLGNDRIITARPVDTYGKDVGLLGPQAVKEASFAPVDINWAGWVGDQDATFEGLRMALLNMYYSAQLGYVAFGSDIGGYRDEGKYPLGRTKELFIRWTQLGALNPVMENGGGGEHRPWKFDTQTTDIYRTFVKLHHALIPYLMDEGAKAFKAKKSLMTFLDKTDYRYMLGPDVFVAPMIKSGTARTVTFPAGNDWIYLFDKTKVHAGGSTASLTVPLDEYPVFLRKGSALATTLAVP